MKKLSLMAMLLVFFILPGTAFSTELVINGGFETGDFTGWMPIGDTNYTHVVDTAHSGIYGAQFGPVNFGYYMQTPNTVAGKTYDLTFWLKNEYVIYPDNEVKVMWGGIELYHLINGAAFDYTEMTFNSLAGAAGNNLTFAFKNQSAYFYLDDVSMTESAVPEPATLLLLGLGLVGLAGIKRKFRK